MKLYGTITSERATKGQGGNDFIAFALTDKEGLRKVIELELFEKEGKTFLKYRDCMGNQVFEDITKS